MTKNIKINIIADPLLSSKIIRDYIHSKTPGYLIDIGVHAEREEVEINGQNIVRSIWITPARGYTLDATKTLNDSSGAIIFFYKGIRQTFEAAKTLYHEYRKIVSSHQPIVFIGINNESNIVTTEEGLKLAKEFNSSYYEMFEEEINIFRKVIDGLSRIILK